MVWLHHFFTMGTGGDVNGVFAITSMIIAVPTGVKIFDWLFTIYGVRVRLHSAMLWSLGFMLTFVVGGATGVLLAIPPADFVLHNSMFLVAHFHNVMVSAVLFGAFSGYACWFPRPSASGSTSGGARSRSGSASPASSSCSAPSTSSACSA